MTVRVHPLSLLRHLYKTYALLPPTSSAATFAAAGLNTNAGSGDADPRFWAVLRSVGSRGALGTQSQRGWWVDEPQRHMHTLDAAEAPDARRVLTVRDLLADVRGVGVLEIHASVSSGKVWEEVSACSHARAASGAVLRILPLDMRDTSAAPQPAPQMADPHAAMLKGLFFNLGETTTQRERREQVPLPYAYHTQSADAMPAQQGTLRGSTGKSDIFFEPESDDDEDDDDPDDDLEL